MQPQIQRSPRRLVSFMDYDLGYFDLETRVVEPLENPFGPKVLPMSSGRTLKRLVGLGGLEPPTSPLSGARSSHLSYRPNGECRSEILSGGRHLIQLEPGQLLLSEGNAYFYWTNPTFGVGPL